MEVIIPSVFDAMLIQAFALEFISASQPCGEQFASMLSRAAKNAAPMLQ